MLQPDCPGFDPYHDNPACEGSVTGTTGAPAGKACCPTTRSLGYVCCAQCCSPIRLGHD